MPTTEQPQPQPQPQPNKVRRHRWSHREGRLTVPRPDNVQAIAAERDYYRRALGAVTKGLPKLQWAAEVCGKMNWSHPEQAVRHARHAVLGGRYDGWPLCEIEQSMAVKKFNSLIVLAAYEVVAVAIRKQLEAERRQGAADHRAAREGRMGTDATERRQGAADQVVSDRV